MTSSSNQLVDSEDDRPYPPHNHEDSASSPLSSGSPDTSFNGVTPALLLLKANNNNNDKVIPQLNNHINGDDDLTEDAFSVDTPDPDHLVDDDDTEDHNLDNEGDDLSHVTDDDEEDDDEEDVFETDPIPLYDAVFPPLSRQVAVSVSHLVNHQGEDDSEADLAAIAEPKSRPSQSPNVIRYEPLKTSIKTQTFKIPPEERRFTSASDAVAVSQGKEESSRGNWEAQQRRLSRDVATKHQVSVEMNLAKDGSLTVFITGRDENVKEAKRHLLRTLQTQLQESVFIPREYHKAILGSKGLLLQELQAQTSTRIQVPKPDANSDFLTVSGPKDNVEHAKQLLQARVDELSRLGFERIPMARVFHSLVFNKTSQPDLYALVESKEVRLGIPPQHIDKDEITVSGEKDAVEDAMELINKIHKRMQRECQEFNIEIAKEKHRYIAGKKGAGRTEVLEQTGVVVQIPPASSPSLTVRLFGPKAKLGPALTMVMMRAESMKTETLNVPSWLHRYIIGKKGQKLEPITKEKVTINFLADSNQICVEGPPSDVDEVLAGLRGLIDQIQLQTGSRELHVDPLLHKHLIGKEGSVCIRIRKETGCILVFPSEPTQSTIRIEGSPEGLDKAVKQVQQIIDSIENSKAKDVIINHKLIPRLIGPKGRNIKELKAKFPKVRFAFPGPDSDSDIVSLRGPRNDVDEAAKALKKAANEVEESSYSEVITIPPEFHKNIVGRDGQMIKQLREETGCRIELPKPETNSGDVVVTGRRTGVKKAISKLKEIHVKQTSIIDITVDLPAYLHTRLIGRRGQRVEDLQKVVGQGAVNVHFPQPDSGSSHISVRGPGDLVAKVKESLIKMAEDEEEQFCEESVPVPFKIHRYVFGLRGSNARRIRDEAGAKVIFPDLSAPEDFIKLSGPKASVLKGKVMLQEIIAEIGDVVTHEVVVDPRFHRHFTKRRGFEITNLNECYGVRVNLPKAGTKGELVKVEGPLKRVQEATKRILEIVMNLENAVSEEMTVTSRHRQYLLEHCREKVFELCESLNVEVHIPPISSKVPPSTGAASSCTAVDSAICSDSSVSNPVKSPCLESNGRSPPPGHTLLNGDVTDVISETSSIASSSNLLGHPLQTHTVTIKGLKDSVAEMKDQLMLICPIEEEVSVPFEMHRLLIGSGGKTISEVRRKHDVDVTLPQARRKANYVTISGLRENVTAARSMIEGMVTNWKKEDEDRRARSFSMCASVDRKHFSLVIGAKGSTIAGLRSKHGVVITIPDQNKDEVIIKGYKENAEAAKRDILEMIRKVENRVTAELVIDPLVHPRLIGSKGSGLERIRKQFAVDVSFPQRNATGSAASVVKITGDPDKVDECSDHVITLANEFLEMMQPSEEEPSSRRQQKFTLGDMTPVGTVVFSGVNKPSTGTDETPASSHPKKKGFVVRNGPWEQPTSSSGGQQRRKVSAREGLGSSSDRKSTSISEPKASSHPTPKIPDAVEAALLASVAGASASSGPVASSWSQIISKKPTSK